MELQKQVTSLEISKKLKSLGVKQESLFYYQIGIDTVIVRQEAKDLGNNYIPELNYISAFTVAELLDIAPASTSMLKRTDIDTNTIPRYYVETFEHYRNDDYDENPANALGKMLIYLLENHLI